MKSIYATVIMLFALSACDKNSIGTTEPIKPTQDVKSFSVTLNFVEAEKIKDTCEKLGVAYTANGCNAFYIPQNHCEIYAVAPKTMNHTGEFQVLGHELLHCRYGAYHE